jgi:UDP-N-acetylmuramoyl-L-alanyl-D-glutamate--2,6-diaminopimelate ligase
VVNIVDGQESFAVRSTPESCDLLSLLDEMVTAGISSGVMEVSSQGIQLGRIDGCSFSVGVFANLYSDYIGISDPPAFAEALDSKIRFARRCRDIVVHRDAEHALEFLDQLGKPAVTYGFLPQADVRAEDIRPEKRDGRLGSVFHLVSPWFCGDVFLGLPCRFQVSNALAAIACAALQGAGLEDVRRALSAAVVPGCVEPVGNRTDFGVFVDSAHTPQTMGRLLASIREYTTGRLICVFGCNGNTIGATRAAMGGEAARLADMTYVTTDNPYLEPPDVIAAEVAAGFGKTRSRPEIRLDRGHAIAEAISNARAGDVVVIAGKGHHNYQMFGNRTEWFSDTEHAVRALSTAYQAGA